MSRYVLSVVICFLVCSLNFVRVKNFDNDETLDGVNFLLLFSLSSTLVCTAPHSFALGGGGGYAIYIQILPSFLPSFSPLFLLRWDSFHNFTRLPPSLPAFLQSPLSAAKYANPAGKGPSYMEPSASVRPPPARLSSRPTAIRSLFGAANWNSFSSSAVLEPPPFPPPSLSLRPLFSVPVPPSSSSSSPLFASYPYAANHAASMGGISRSLPLLLSS